MFNNMHREDRSKYLLFIEPPKKEKLAEPVEDELVKLMEMAITKAETGVSSYMNEKDGGNFRKSSGYKGFHQTDCGETSSNKDYLLENEMITNSLAPFYLRWYRNSIPESEIEKLMSLKKFYEI
jgi:hypothetical protein